MPLDRHALWSVTWHQPTALLIMRLTREDSYMFGAAIRVNAHSCNTNPSMTMDKPNHIPVSEWERAVLALLLL